MDKILVQATNKDYEAVLKHYDRIIEDTPDMDKYARWKKGMHPKAESIREYIETKAMYLLKDGEEIVGSMAVTMSQDEDYHDIEWKIAANDEEAAVIHLLGVNPQFQKKGIGGEMVDAAIRLAGEHGKKVLRLDALDSNTPAKAMYIRKGFTYCGKKNLYADNTGWTDFCFFEMEPESDKYIRISDSQYILQHIQDIQKLLKQSYWAKNRDIDTIRTSIENSCCFAMVDRDMDTIVAFARAITDFATMYYLADVIVDERYRKKGLGKKMISWITEQEPRLKSKHGVLLTKDAQDFYSQYGFCDYADHCMCKL